MTLCYWLQTRGFSPKGTPFDCVFSAGWQKLMERNDKPIFRELNPFLGSSQGLGPSVLMSFFRSLEKNQGAKTKIRELSATAPLTTPWITHIFYPFGQYFCCPLVKCLHSAEPHMSRSCHQEKYRIDKHNVYTYFNRIVLLHDRRR